MPRIPIVSARTVISYLEHIGFQQVRQKGSQKFFKHPDGRTATVPDHKGEDLGRGITLKILKDVKISAEEFLNWHS